MTFLDEINKGRLEKNYHLWQNDMLNIMNCIFTNSFTNKHFEFIEKAIFNKTIKEKLHIMNKSLYYCITLHKLERIGIHHQIYCKNYDSLYISIEKKLYS